MRGRNGRLATLAAVGAAVTLMVSLVMTARPATARGFATLRVLEGIAEVRSGDEAFRPGLQGQTLQAGDVVRTGATGLAEIGYFDGSVTRLDAATTLRIAVLGILQGEPVLSGEQEGGRTFNRVVKLTGSDGRFSVATPTATASVAGTTFATRHLRDGTMEVSVLEGAVDVRPDRGQAVVVRMGFGVTVLPDGSVRGPNPLGYALLFDPWLRSNLCFEDGGVFCSHPVGSDAAFAGLHGAPAPGGDQGVEEGASGGSSSGMDGSSRSSASGTQAPTGGPTTTPKQSPPNEPPPQPPPQPPPLDALCAVVRSVAGDVGPPCN